jgi:hypothetical protein
VGAGGGPVFLANGHEQSAGTTVTFAANIQAGVGIQIGSRELVPAIVYRNFVPEYEHMPFVPSDRSTHQVGFRVAVGI